MQSIEHISTWEVFSSICPKGATVVKGVVIKNSLFVMLLKNKCLFDVVLFHCLNKLRRLVLEAWVV